MKNILVTGGAGFVGSNFVHYLIEKRPQQYNIIVYDKLTYAANLDNLKSIFNQITFIKGDICNKSLLEKVCLEFNIDTIAHFAAESHVDNSIDDPEPFIQSNIVGTFRILELTRKYDLRATFISTDEVFGDLPLDEPTKKFTEDSPYNPSSPYSASKAAGDHLVRAYIRTYGIKATISNCSNIYGPRQYYEKLLPKNIINGLQGKPLILYGDGLNIRDWTWHEDHSSAILTILEKGTIGDTYLIGTNNEQTNKSILEKLSKKFNVPIIKVADRKGHDLRYAIDSSKLQRDLGWTPSTVDFDSRLDELIKWYKTNPDFWSKKIKA